VSTEPGVTRLCRCELARELLFHKVCECMRAAIPCVIQEERAPKVASEATEVTSEEELPSEVATGAPIEEAKALEIAPEASEAPTKASGEAEAGKQSYDAGKVTEAAHTTTKVNDVEVAIIEAIEINEAQRSQSTAKIAETKVAAAEGGVSMKTVESPMKVAKTTSAQQAARV
jgi:hypothetical protein